MPSSPRQDFVVFVASFDLAAVVVAVESSDQAQFLSYHQAVVVSGVASAVLSAVLSSTSALSFAVALAEAAALAAEDWQ